MEQGITHLAFTIGGRTICAEPMRNAMLVNDPARQIKSVKTAFELVNRVQALGGATPAQLTEGMDLSKSSVHNYLVTLEMEGYLVNRDGTYQLGLRFLTHGTAAKSMPGVEGPILTTIRDLAEDLSLPVWWVTEECGRGFFVESATPEDATDVYGRVGKRSYLHTNALGKAVLAVSPDEFLGQVAKHHGLPERTKETTTDVDELRSELDAVRERGFAVSDGEEVLGILSVGSGFRDGRSRTHAVGIFGPTRNFAGNSPQKVGDQLVDAVEPLERTLRDKEE